VVRILRPVRDPGTEVAAPFHQHDLDRPGRAQEPDRGQRAGEPAAHDGDDEPILRDSHIVNCTKPMD
jgi:hypothetical protein